MVGKRFSENLSKIHPELCQTFKMKIFDRVLKMLFTGNVLTHLIRYYLFKVSKTTSGKGSYNYFFWLNCLEYEQVNVSWLVIIDLEKILISVSV